MSKEEIEQKIVVIHGQLEATQESIAELLKYIPDARPYPELYKTAQYLEKFTDSLEIGKKNIDRLTGGRSHLPPKRYV